MRQNVCASTRRGQRGARRHRFERDAAKRGRRCSSRGSPGSPARRPRRRPRPPCACTRRAAAGTSASWAAPRPAPPPAPAPAVRAGRGVFLHFSAALGRGGFAHRDLTVFAIERELHWKVPDKYTEQQQASGVETGFRPLHPRSAGTRTSYIHTYTARCISPCQPARWSRPQHSNLRSVRRRSCRCSSVAGILRGSPA